MKRSKRFWFHSNIKGISISQKKEWNHKLRILETNASTKKKWCRQQQCQFLYQKFSSSDFSYILDKLGSSFSISFSLSPASLASECLFIRGLLWKIHLIFSIYCLTVIVFYFCCPTLEKDLLPILWCSWTSLFASITKGKIKSIFRKHFGFDFHPTQNTFSEFWVKIHHYPTVLSQ